jgi:hypothetical protein
VAAFVLMAHVGCAPAESTPDGTGGTVNATGGSAIGSATGGATSTGGAPGTGGAFVGTGGAGTGGASTGGASTGGTTGGTASGGSGTGGAATGGAVGGRVGASGGAGPMGGRMGGGGGIVAAGGAPPQTGSGCAGKAYKLCDDFEMGTAGGMPTGWTAYKGYGAGAATDVGLASDEFHSGAMALKSNSAKSGQGRIQKSLSALGATATKHWGRIFYKVQTPAAKNASGVLHVTWVGLLGTGENRVVDIVESSSGTHQWLYNNPDDKGSLGSAYNWSFDTAWHCAEWYVDVTAKSYRFFSDSKEVTQIGFTGKADSEMSNYMAVIVGATFYQQPNAAFIMWFDDLAIDDNQIGCQ